MAALDLSSLDFIPDAAKPDVQRLAISGYAHLPYTATIVVTLAGAIAAAKAWLGAIVPLVVTAARRDGTAAVNVALTASGLRRLGLPEATVASFPVAFFDGMASPRRAALLGDAGNGESDPGAWRWGGTAPGTPAVDAIVLVYARTPEVLDERVAAVGALLVPAAGTAFELPRSYRVGRHREHFGFVDGISQPAMPRDAHPAPPPGPLMETPAGEFLIGYRNGNGDAAAAFSGDFGRNGSFLVVRQLEQDVPAFWGFAARAAHELYGDTGRAEDAAAKLVGRTVDGVPTGLAAGGATAATNDFGYAEHDRAGTGCPVGAHVRRANPRDTHAEDAPLDSFRRIQRHRLLRRGRAYGPPIADRTVPDGVERGLHFMCLVADLERQFEFVMQTWIDNPVFGDLNGEVDPLLGNQRDRGNGIFTIPCAPYRKRLHGVPGFVTTRGGTYAFLPSLTALAALARQ